MYQAIATVKMVWVGDGANQMSVPGAQSLSITLAPITMTGGNTVNTTNTNSLGTSVGSAVQTALATATVQAQLTGWATGSP